MNDIIVSVLILTGAAFMLIAAIGLLKFKDLFCRIHATTKSTSFGILFIIIAVSIYFHTIDVYIRATIIIMFIYLTAPLAAHAIAKSFIDKDKVVDSDNKV